MAHAREPRGDEVGGGGALASLAATQMCRRGIEALGGNGTIKDFSPLPKLYQDAIVFEN